MIDKFIEEKKEKKERGIGEFDVLLELPEIVCLRLIIDVKEGEFPKEKRKNSCNSFRSKPP